MNSRLETQNAGLALARCLFPLLGEMARVRASIVLVLFLLTPSARAATFTTNALITEADSSFDGQDIVVSGATLTVDGRHSFNSLLLTNGAVLTHTPCTTTNTHKLDLVVTNEIVGQHEQPD